MGGEWDGAPVRRMPSTHPCLLVCLLFILGIPATETGARAHQITPSEPPFVTIPISFPEATYEEAGEYICVEVEGCTGLVRQAGSPLLPFWSTMLSLPLGTLIDSVSIGGAFYREYIITRTIAPAPEPIPSLPGACRPPLFKGPVYERDRLFPETELDFTLTTGWGPEGPEAHLFIKLYPLKYNPLSGRVVQLVSGKIEVRCIPPPSPLMPRGNETYTILAICPAEFEGEMQKYADHKTSIGLSCRVVNLTAVYDGSIFNVSAGRDSQEKIKLFIKQALENWSIQYVVLAGDVDKVPIRRVYINDIDGTSTPTDLYYGDIYKDGGLNFSDWDYDRDNVFGESTSSSANADKVDLDPDVSVGRLPAGTVAELKAIINKTISYDENITSRPDWFRNATLVGTDTFGPSRGDNSGIAEGEYACDMASAFIPLFNFSKFYEKSGTFSISGITSAMNAGCGLALFSDHGSVGGVCYPDSGGGPGLSSSTAQNLNNGHKLPLSILDACLTHSVDSSECLGEYLILNPIGGSIASIGHTRIGYGSFGTYHVRWNSGYMLVHLIESFSQGTIAPAAMLDETKRSYLNNVGIWDYADFKTLVEYIQLGDPIAFIGGPCIDATPENESLWAYPGEAVEYRITVANNGLHAEQLSLSTSGGSWVTTLDPEHLRLKAGATANVTVRVEVPARALAYQEELTTLSILQGSTGIPIELGLRTCVKCVRKVELALEVGEFRALPGDTVPVNFTIRNSGNIEESACVTLSGGGGWWTPELSISGLTVGPWGERAASLELAVPQKTLSGRYSFLTDLRTESGLCAAAPLMVEVLKTYGIALETNQTEALAGPRGALFRVNLKNIGNHQEPVELSLSGIPEGWSALFPSVLTLGAFEEQEIQLVIIHARRALAGQYPICLTARDSSGLNSASLELSAAVERVSSLELSCPDARLAVDQGSDVSFEALVHSESNFPEHIEIDITGLPEGWDWFLGSEELSLPPFSSGRAVATIQVPPLCAAGAYRFELVASTEGWSASRNLTVQVRESRSFTLLADMTQQRLSPGDSVEFNLSIKNTGNCGDTYVLSLQDGAVAQFSRNYISVGAGGVECVTLTVSIPESAVSGLRPLLVRAASSIDPSLSRSALLEVWVERVSRLELEFLNSSIVLEGGEGFFPVVVRNMGPETETISLTPLRGPLWPLPQAPVVIPPGGVRELVVRFAVPSGTPAGFYNISLIAASELQSWELIHSVQVVGRPHTGANGLPPGGSSVTDYTVLPAALIVLLLVTLIAGLALIARLSRR